MGTVASTYQAVKTSVYIIIEKWGHEKASFGNAMIVGIIMVCGLESFLVNCDEFML